LSQIHLDSASYFAAIATVNGWAIGAAEAEWAAKYKKPPTHRGLFVRFLKVYYDPDQDYSILLWFA